MGWQWKRAACRRDSGTNGKRSGNKAHSSTVVAVRNEPHPPRLGVRWFLQPWECHVTCQVGGELGKSLASCTARLARWLHWRLRRGLRLCLPSKKRSWATKITNVVTLRQTFLAAGSSASTSTLFSASSPASYMLSKSTQMRLCLKLQPNLSTQPPHLRNIRSFAGKLLEPSLRLSYFNMIWRFLIQSSQTRHPAFDDCGCRSYLGGQRSIFLECWVSGSLMPAMALTKISTRQSRGGADHNGISILMK